MKSNFEIQLELVLALLLRHLDLSESEKNKLGEDIKVSLYVDIIAELQSLKITPEIRKNLVDTMINTSDVEIDQIFTKDLVKSMTVINEKIQVYTYTPGV